MGWACRGSTPLCYGPVLFQELVPISVCGCYPSVEFSKSKKLIMKQERLNNLMIHKEHTDELVLKQVTNDFVSVEVYL